LKPHDVANEAEHPVNLGVIAPAGDPGRSPAPSSAAAPAVSAGARVGEQGPLAVPRTSSTSAQQGSAAPAAANQKRAGASATATAAVPAASASAPPRVTGTVDQPQVGPCTDAVATLGLCEPQPIQRRE
jgi:hypothetical protein